MRPGGGLAAKILQSMSNWSSLVRRCKEQANRATRHHGCPKSEHGPATHRPGISQRINLFRGRAAPWVDCHSAAALVGASAHPARQSDLLAEVGSVSKAGRACERGGPSDKDLEHVTVQIGRASCM